MKKNYFVAVSILTCIGLANFAFGQTNSWWQENSQTFSKLRNVNFADNNTGWVFGDSSNVGGFVTGIIKKSTDQGQTWAYQNMGSNNFRIYSSYFFNISSGIAVGRSQATGQGIVMRTGNGGTSWTTDSLSFPDRLMDVDFSGGSIGWTCGRNGYLARTNDSGVSWTVQNTGTPEHLFSLDFVDTTSGWAVGADPGTGGTIVRTTDGGGTWTLQTNTAPNDLLAVYAFDKARAIAVGLAGTIVITADSGNTWTPVISGTPEDLLDVKFTDSNHGWIGCTAGVMLISSDGGNTWTPQVSNTTNNINSICMKDTTLGWYCGDNGDIYYYGSSPASVDDLIVTHSAKVFPNPMTDASLIQLEGSRIDQWSLMITDMAGKRVKEINDIRSSSFLIRRDDLSPGMYIYSAYDSNGVIAYGKLSIK